MMPTDKLAAVLWEADRHLNTLMKALAEWSVSPAITWQALENDRARVRIVDQLLLRFITLQDTVVERLIPATLSNLRGLFEDWPIHDRLNRLKKLGYLKMDNWLAGREVCNRLAHEYPDQSEVRFTAPIAAIDTAKTLAAPYRNWRARLEGN